MQTLEKPRKTPKVIEPCIVEAALKSQKSNKKIAQELGVHKETVVSWRRKFGIPRFTPHTRCREIVLKVLSTAPDGVYQSELVRHCGCSRQKLYWILKAMRLEGKVYAEGETNARKWYLVKT